MCCKKSLSRQDSLSKITTLLEEEIKFYEDTFNFKKITRNYKLY